MSFCWNEEIPLGLVRFSFDLFASFININLNPIKYAFHWSTCYPSFISTVHQLQILCDTSIFSFFSWHVNMTQTLCINRKNDIWIKISKSVFCLTYSKNLNICVDLGNKLINNQFFYTWYSSSSSFKAAVF